jgi:hypothetical protein
MLFNFFWLIVPLRNLMCFRQWRYAKLIGCKYVCNFSVSQIFFQNYYFKRRSSGHKKAPKLICLEAFVSFPIKSGDPAGTRTQDPYIKSVLLYQLSYGIKRG